MKCESLFCGVSFASDTVRFVNGFELDETLAAVEAWADTQTALGGQSA